MDSVFQKLEDIEMTAEAIVNIRVTISVQVYLQLMV